MSVEETNDTHEHFNQSLYQWATKRLRERLPASGEGTNDTHEHFNQSVGEWGRNT